MVVQHNLQAMNANRMLGITTKESKSSTEKLSSGYKINRAADDAAGLAISEKMRKQIRGLDQASTNAEDGISCVQTAEGALAEVHDMLQRMNELCVQAANGTNSVTDRQYIQDELDQLVSEIDRISQTTKFNETYLLKGDELKTPKNVYMTNYSTTYTRNITSNVTTNGIEYKTNYTGTNNLYIVSASIYTTNPSMSLTGHKIEHGKDITEYMRDAKTPAQATNVNHANAELDTDKWVAFVNVELNSNVQKGSGGNVSSVVNSDTSGKYDLSNDGTTSVVRADRDLYVYNVDTGTVTRLTAGTEMEKYLNDDNTMNEHFRLVDVLYGDMSNAPNTITGDGTFSSKRVLDTVLDSTDYAWTDNNLKRDESLQQLYDVNGKPVSGMALNKYFDEGGNYLGGLYTTDQARAIDEVFANNTEASVKLKNINDVATGATIARYITQSSQEVMQDLTLSLQAGADADRSNKVKVDLTSLTSAGLGIDKLSSFNIGIVDTTGENATDAIDVVAEALTKVSRQRSALGAIQNRLDHTIKNLDNVVENTTAAEAQIRDTDMAEEMVKYSNTNILQQAGQAMLAQSNQANQGVLSLLQ